jgi:hypothetical protein
MCELFMCVCVHVCGVCVCVCVCVSAVLLYILGISSTIIGIMCCRGMRYVCLCGCACVCLCVCVCVCSCVWCVCSCVVCVFVCRPFVHSRCFIHDYRDYVLLSRCLMYNCVFMCASRPFAYIHTYRHIYINVPIHKALSPL